MKKTLLIQCSALAITALFTVNFNAFGQLTLTTTQTNVVCNGDNTGSATVIPANGTNHYSYSWSPSGGTNATATGLSAGIYTVTVTDTVSVGASTATLYTQGFEGAHGWTLNVSTGINGADPNFWKVSDAEGGVAAGGCGVETNGNKTLHVTSVFSPNAGASYDAGGLCGFFFCPQTNARAESPSFSTIGHTGTTLEFDYIANGDALLDNASVYYNSGAGWQVLTASLKSTICGTGQGLWTHYTMALPVSCDNNASVQVAINWTNNDDGVGTDPSVAINDVVVKGTTPGTPVYDIKTATVTITEAAVLSSNLSATACGSYTLNGQIYTTSGPHTQVVQNGNGCDSTINLTLTINPLPNSGITSTGPLSLKSSATGVTYTWINCSNNQAVANGSAQTYTATANGSYAVIVNNGTCADTSACMTINQVGIENLAEAIQFSMYPNPVTNKLTLSFDNNMSVNADILTVDGKLLRSYSAIASGEILDLELLNSGVYFIQINSPKGTLLERFVKE